VMLHQPRTSASDTSLVFYFGTHDLDARVSCDTAQLVASLDAQHTVFPSSRQQSVIQGRWQLILKSGLKVCISVLCAGRCRVRGAGFPGGGEGKEKEFAELEVQESGGVQGDASEIHIFSSTVVNLMKYQQADAGDK
jgi:hypothetical protein